jgi:hypothetical protein
MTFDKKDKLEIFDNAISWVVVFAMLVYGFGKMVQFENPTLLDKTVSEMTGMELMWAFYGYSKAFPLILGLLEITGGLLILFRPTRLIGCLFTSTILINVIIQDILFGVHIGALKAAILYQVLILIVLWLNKEQLISSIKGLLLMKENKGSKTQIMLKIITALILFVAFRIAEYYVTIRI